MLFGYVTDQLFGLMGIQPDSTTFAAFVDFYTVEFYFFQLKSITGNVETGHASGILLGFNGSKSLLVEVVKILILSGELFFELFLGDWVVDILA